VVSKVITKIKASITIDPCLARFHNDIVTYINRTDVSDFGIRAIFHHIQPIIDITSTFSQPLSFEELGYFFRKLLYAEMQYSTYDTELLVMKNEL
jgi:hypothetical protein